MKLILLLLIFTCYHSVSGQIWSEVSNFPGSPRDDGAGFKIGEDVYFGTGLDNTFSTKGDFYKFNLFSESWTEVSSLPVGKERQYSVGATYNNEGYLFGGINGQGNYLNDFWRYNSITDTWAELQPLPGAGRSGSVVFTLNDVLYIVGGKSQLSSSLSEVWCYDFMNSNWSQKNDIPQTELWRGAGFVINNQGYIGLGRKADGSINNSFYEYDEITDNWSELNSLTITGRVYPAYAVIDSQLYIYGGEIAGGTYSNEFLRIDIENESFETLENFASDARRGSYGFSSSSDFYLTTGVTATTRTNETWKSNYVVSIDGKDPLKSSLTVVNNTIRGISELEKNVNVCVLATDGRSIIEINNTSEDVEINQVMSGVYFVRIWNEDFEYNIKSYFN